MWSCKTDVSVSYLLWPHPLSAWWRNLQQIDITKSLAVWLVPCKLCWLCRQLEYVGLLKRDGIHPLWECAALLSKKISYSLRNSIFWHTRAKARQQTYCPTQISACSQELLSRFHAIEIVSACRTKLSLAKKAIRGVCMANLKKTRPCYSTNNMDDQSNQKIGLINIRSLAPKATLVNELITDH